MPRDAKRRGFQDPDIYARHLLASGTVDAAWPPNGLALCTMANQQSSPTIAADGAGGAIVSWFDYRSGTNQDIYAQHVRGSGTNDPVWPADGRALCIAVGDQVNPMIVSDGAAGAIVTWEDTRSGPYDVYAQRVYADGQVAAVGPGIARNIGLHPPLPNPARGQVSLGFDLPVHERVRIEVLDVAGRRVRDLVSSQEFGAGTHGVTWNCTNDAGAPLESGVYVVRLSDGIRSVARNLAILR